jgi:cyclophilin family peptidyl-prolyl cis-trans isomerase
MSKTPFIALAICGFFAVTALTLQAANPQVLMKTSKGDITIELFQDKAPISVKNFLSYVDEKFYDETIFHRVIKGFMVQGGGMTADMREKPRKPSIKNEAANGLKNKRGTLAMARTPEIDSATCQFFINLVDNAFLDHQSNDPEKFGYAVFGKVVAGMDVVDAIAGVPTGTRGGQQDVPREPITILSVTRLESK